MHMKTKYENCILLPMHIAIHYVTTNTSTHTVADPEYLHPQTFYSVHVHICTVAFLIEYSSNQFSTCYKTEKA